MTQQSDAQLSASALQIRNETIPNANSATRVGQMLVNLVDSKRNKDTPVPINEVEMGVAGQYPAMNGNSAIVWTDRPAAMYSVRMISAKTLPAYTRVNDIITANANGAWLSSNSDNVTPLNPGELILITKGAALADNGIYKFNALGSGGAPWALERVRPMSSAFDSTWYYPGLRFIATEGDFFRGSVWQLMTTGSLLVNTSAMDFRLVEIVPRVASHTSSGASAQDVSGLSVTIPEGWTVEAVLKAVGRASSEYARYEKHATYTRLSGGNVVEDWNANIGGSPKEVDAAWNANIVVDGTTGIKVQVQANSDNPVWDIKLFLEATLLP